MTERQRLHNEIKRLKSHLNISTSTKWNIKTVEMRSNLQNLRNIENESLTFNEGGNIRNYYVRGLDLLSTTISELQPIIDKRLIHALRSFTTGADVNIHLSFEHDNIKSGKSFNSFNLRDKDTFWRRYKEWSALNVANTPQYVYNIVEIGIKIIKENGGGCNKRLKITHKNDTVRRYPEATNNNCFFNCVFDKLDIDGAQRVGKVACNKIRAEFKLEADATIPISSAIAIFEKYKKDDMIIQIVDNETLITHGYKPKEEDKRPVITIVLEKEHYSIMTRKPTNRCAKCGKNYRKEHTCTPSVESYFRRKIMKTGERVLLHTIKPELRNTQDNVIHYDLETFKRVKDNHKIHTPYYCGYTDEERKFKYFSGPECTAQFLDYVLDRAKKNPQETLYVNAFNGSNFDHYMFVREFINRGIKPKKQIVNNGAIISFEYKNIKLFDICKHLQGGLADNLEAFKCKVQKGTFNHDEVIDFETMSQEMKDECLIYLESDVMGLQELYDMLNTVVFEKYQVNLTSYISTSSLTFNQWKKIAVKKYIINLPTLKQEKAFRKAIRGGRTYKNKHTFKSLQYEEFKTNKNYNDVDDYIVDCDVVSLYPSAMAQYEYPIGECKVLLPSEGDKLTMLGKMGIYKINYITNKNLIQPILGRRGDKGELRWDLKDSKGYYTNVEIEDALASGYQIEILKGYYWENTAFVFKEYIEKLFEDKDIEAKAGRKGSPYYQLCKLFMNGLYGKNIQRPIYTNTAMIKTSLDYWKFWGKNDITDLVEIDSESGEKIWLVSGNPKNIVEREECITKPTQLGAFILAYSRRIMVGYMKEANPHFESEDQKAAVENDFFYTDTDSLQMKASNAKLMTRLGDNKLGGITDDLGSAKIVRGIWIAPKLYMLEYITEDSINPINEKEKYKCLCGCEYENGVSRCGITRKKDGTIIEIKDGIKYYHHLRGKGLNKDSLSCAVFEKMNDGGSMTSTRPFQMKKVHTSKNSKQQNIPAFSIIHLDNIVKTVNINKWRGRNFIGPNESIPHR